MTIAAPDAHTDDAPVGETIVSVGRVARPTKVDAGRYTDPGLGPNRGGEALAHRLDTGITLDHVSSEGMRTSTMSAACAHGS